MNRVVVRKPGGSVSLYELAFPEPGLATVRLTVSSHESLTMVSIDLDATDLAALKVFIDGYTQATSRGEPEAIDGWPEDEWKDVDK